MQTIEPGDWTALNETLVKYARVVNNLRRRVEALEQAGASPSPREGGTYTPKPDCLVCGKPKPAGRTALTCHPCGQRRNAIIYGKEGDRSELVTTECGQCGASKKPSTHLLCPPCSHAFKAWKAAK